MAVAIFIIFSMDRTSPDKRSEFIDSCKTMRVLKLIFLLERTKKNTGIDIKPSPPISINNKMTAWPKNVQCSLVVSVVRPVTQTAEVAVKSESMKGVISPPLDEMGSIKTPAPLKIKLANPKEIV